MPRFHHETGSGLRHTDWGARGEAFGRGTPTLSIARALLKNAPILILDEATSSLDSDSEAEVQKALDRLMENRTVFVIAHRLSTIRNADRILVLSSGELVEEGTHDELMARQGEYHRLHQLQFKTSDADIQKVQEENQIF